MTANQIAYQRVLEEIRSNKAREEETRRANMALEAIRQAELSEAQRHNRESEAEMQRSNLARELENNRHNTATESLTLQNIYATKEVAYAKLAEERRHNIVSEVETSTHNENTEYLQNKQIDQTKSNITTKAAADLALQHYKEQQENKRQEQRLRVELQKAAMTAGGRMTSDLMKALVQYSTVRTK